MKNLTLHNLIEKEGNLYVALCLELDIASQGKTVEKARKNLQDAVQGYLELIYDEGIEKEFIPRPAPLQKWLKYLDLDNQA